MEKVSKNYYKGTPIFSPRYLVQLVEEKKSLYHYRWGLKPAAFIIQQPFRSVMKMLDNSILYTIEKIPEEEIPKPRARIFRKK